MISAASAGSTRGGAACSRIGRALLGEGYMDIRGIGTDTTIRFDIWMARVLDELSRNLVRRDGGRSGQRADIQRDAVTSGDHLGEYVAVRVEQRHAQLPALQGPRALSRRIQGPIRRPDVDADRVVAGQLV